LSPEDQQPVDYESPVGAAAGAGARPGEPSEEDRSEIDQRAAYEAELSRLTSTDVMAQAVVSLLNIGARRLAPAGDPQGAAGAAPPERDLEQARDAIDAVRALLEILERRIPRELAPLRDALSRLQMAYAHEIGPVAAGAGAQPAGGDAGAGGAPAGASSEQGRDPDPAQPQRPPGPGPAESSGRLWVPGR
jgi:hypothetical protein